MEPVTDNMQKYLNYREQMGRLKKAMHQQFYLEAIFIEYAIMEDRLESALRHGGKWNPKPDAFVSLDSKRKKLAKLAEDKNSLEQRYFSPELTDRIGEWKDKRNRIIHALLKQSLHTEDLLEIAEEGEEIAKTLRTKVNAYNKALERHAISEKERKEPTYAHHQM